MDDMNPFEQQVAAEVAREMRPSRPVDAVAVIAAVDAVRSPRWRFQTMFSATKFLVAGAIVALFGGFLLSGVMTQQPSDEPPPPAAASTSASPLADPTWTPPPELVMVEIAPGVTKAAVPGVSSLESWWLDPETSPQQDAVAEERVLISMMLQDAEEETNGPYEFDFTFDREGDLWLLSPAGLLRVGDDTAYPSPGQMWHYPDLSSAPDGALWALANDTVASFRDGAWTAAPPFPGDAPADALEVLPDGTVWARSTTTLARLDGDAWTAHRITDEQGPVPERRRHFPGALSWTPDGSLWVTTNGARKRKTGDLLRFDGEVFHPVELPVPVEGWIGPLASGPDGELWAYLDADPPRLARFDGTDWGASGRVPRIATDLCSGRMVSAPDGRLWAIPRKRGPQHHDCDGDVLGAYDGATWTGVGALPESWLTEVAKLHMGPDGNLWVESAPGLFLIAAPEAVTAE
jgi:hypothetical protein